MKNQKKINRNNRKRGGAFEKRVADLLDMDVVPYSGSNSRYGYGDVRDTVWLGECKNITPKNNNVTLQMKWFNKNIERARNIKHTPFLAWMPAGKPDKYIILEDIDMFGEYDNSIVVDLYRPNATNLIININDDYMMSVKKGHIVKLTLHGRCWYMMNIMKFREYIYKYNKKGDRQTDGLC